MSKTRGGSFPVSSKPDGNEGGGLIGVTMVVPPAVTCAYVSVMSVADPTVPMLTITLEPTGVTGVTGSGGKARNSGPSFESTTVPSVLPGVNFRISPVVWGKGPQQQRDCLRCQRPIL